MTKTKSGRPDVLVDEALDPEVISFQGHFDQRSPFDEIVKEGARRMLQAAIDAEVDAFIQPHADRTDEHGRRLGVKNGNLPEREILTGAGAIAVTQGRVRDNDPDRSKRITFSPSVLSSYLRKTKRSGTRRASLTMMFKLAESASKKWRRLNCHEKIPLSSKDVPSKTESCRMKLPPNSNSQNTHSAITHLGSRATTSSQCVLKHRMLAPLWLAVHDGGTGVLGGVSRAFGGPE